MRSATCIDRRSCAAACRSGQAPTVISCIRSPSNPRIWTSPQWPGTWSSVREACQRKAVTSAIIPCPQGPPGCLPGLADMFRLQHPKSVCQSQTVCHEHCDACAGAARLPAVGHAAGVLQRLPRPTKGFFCAGSHAGAQMLNPKVSLAGLENTRGAEACLSFWKACTWQCKALAEFFQVTIVALTTI